MFGFGKRMALTAEQDTDSHPIQRAAGNVNVVRTVTMPNGKKVRVLRKDAFDRAILAKRSVQPA